MSLRNNSVEQRTNIHLRCININRTVLVNAFIVSKFLIIQKRNKNLTTFNY